MGQRPNRPKNHTFDNRKYQIVWKKVKGCNGLCEAPTNHSSERRIFIAPSLKGKELVETLIHESLHAELWCLDEETVTRVAVEITELLSKCDLLKIER